MAIHAYRACSKWVAFLCKHAQALQCGALIGRSRHHKVEQQEVSSRIERHSGNFLIGPESFVRGWWCLSQFHIQIKPQQCRSGANGGLLNSAVLVPFIANLRDKMELLETIKRSIKQIAEHLHFTSICFSAYVVCFNPATKLLSWIRNLV